MTHYRSIFTHLNMLKRVNGAAKMPAVKFSAFKTELRVNLWHLLVIFLCFNAVCVQCQGVYYIDKKDDLKGSDGHSHHMHDRQCVHAHPKADDVVRGVHIEPEHIVKKRSLDQPLRIVLYYDESVYRLEAEKFDLINNTILPEAVQFWERTLMVRKTGDVIRLNRKCSSRQVFVKGGRTHCIGKCREITTCGEVQVPEDHLNPCYVCNSTGQACGRSGDGGDGVADADFVLYVSAIETERCQRGLTVAYAAHCQQESVLDRPIAGHANFCPAELSTRPQELGSMLSTVQHEMLHALGFSVSLYAFYRDDDGNPLTARNPDTGSPPLNEELQIHQWSEKVVRNVTRERWMVRGGYMTRNIQVMVTPRVVKEVRNHFSCSSLEGAELEDQGGEGTALTHWEKRIMENEAMTGTHTQNPVFSRVTLALMEDTGWYKADYDQAGELNWGKGLGCAFVTRSCKEWIKNASNRPAHPFCSRVKRDPLQTECSQQRESVALCNLVLHDKPLPPLYQHFDWIAEATPGTESHYGGSVSLADYCPYTQEFTWRFGSVVVRGSRCSFSDNNPKVDKNFALESYGEKSKCFDHTNRMWEQRSCRQVRQWQHWGSGCYEYKCENGRLHIMVGNYSYECYHAGQEMSVRIVRGGWLHRGALLCPPCKDLCNQQFEERGEWCKPGDEAPPNTYYPHDELRCATGSSNNAGGGRTAPRPHALAVSVSLGVLLSFTGLCLCGDAAAWAARIAGKRGQKRSAIKLANMSKTENNKFKLEEVVVTDNLTDMHNSTSKSDADVNHPSITEDHKTGSTLIEDKTDPQNVGAFEEAIRTALGIEHEEKSTDYEHGDYISKFNEDNTSEDTDFNVITVSTDSISELCSSKDEMCNSKEDMHSSKETLPKKSVKFCIQNEKFEEIGECSRINSDGERRKLKESFDKFDSINNKMTKNDSKLKQLDAATLMDESPTYFQLDAPVDVELCKEEDEEIKMAARRNDPRVFSSDR